VSENNRTGSDSRCLFDMLKQRYGERLAPEQLRQVKKGVEANQQAAEKLRVVKLENSDEPFARFVPYRKRG
jgi:hypothetical protein